MFIIYVAAREMKYLIQRDIWRVIGNLIAHVNLHIIIGIVTFKMYNLVIVSEQSRLEISTKI